MNINEFNLAMRHIEHEADGDATHFNFLIGDDNWIYNCSYQMLTDPPSTRILAVKHRDADFSMFIALSEIRAIAWSPQP